MSPSSSSATPSPDLAVDYDVIVVGAGVAGLTAALRTRWLGCDCRTEPITVAVLEASREVGGFAAWRSVELGGPSFRFRRTELNLLLDDVLELGIQIMEGAVESIDVSGPVKVLKSGDRQLSCRSVVLALGMTPATNAVEFFRKGNTYFTFANPEQRKEELAKRLAEKRSKYTTEPRTKTLIYGTDRVLETASQLDLSGCTVLVEPPFLRSSYPEGVVLGKLVRILGDSQPSGVEIVDREGAARTLPCDSVFLDFNSYEAHGNSTVFLDGTGISCDQGFIQVDRNMQTSVEGVFAAGDCTGPMFAVSKAIAEGTIAGFSAYRYVYRQQTGLEANCYPFYTEPPKGTGA